MRSIVGRECLFLTGGVACLAFMHFVVIPSRIMESPLGLVMTLGLLFAVTPGVRHFCGSPCRSYSCEVGRAFCTLVLTLSVTTVEAASISTVMLHGANNPTLARDTLFAVIMIILNGMVGASLLIGGWRSPRAAI